MFAKVEDGPGYSLVMFFAMKPEFRDEIAAGSSPAATLLKVWLAGLDDPAMHGRLKAIPRLANLDDLDLGGPLKKLVSSYNAKPFMTGPTCHRIKRDPAGKYLEVSVNLHRFW